MITIPKNDLSKDELTHIYNVLMDIYPDSIPMRYYYVLNTDLNNDFTDISQYIIIKKSLMKYINDYSIGYLRSTNKTLFSGLTFHKHKG